MAGGNRSWLQEHLETFVVPYLGFVPAPLNPLTPVEMTVIKNTWRSIKKSGENKTIILPGRDVFIFEILARREGYPTVFMPEVSRNTVSSIKLPYDLEKVLIVDTGFMGSIPQALGVTSFILVSHYEKKSKQQIFPRLTNARQLALRIEYTPKYWKRGSLHYECGEPFVLQELSDLREFAAAAAMTIAVYKDSSPTFFKERRPLPTNLHSSSDQTWHD